MVAGQRLRQARKKLHLTQEELAEMIGVRAAEISQYESNKRTPRWSTFDKLLNALHLTADEVLGREIVVGDGNGYEIRIAKEDLEILSCIKKNEDLYHALLANPERNAQIINENIKKVLPIK